MAVYCLRGLLGALFVASLGSAALAAGHPDFGGYWMVEHASEKMLTSGNTTPPLKPAAAKLYETNSAAKAKGDTGFDPVARCILPGMPRMMAIPYPIEILQTPQEMTMLFAWNRLSRNFKLSGTGYEPDYPIAAGVSVGHWQGPTLVVSTAGTRDDTLLDAYGMPHSEQMKITERLSLSQHGKRLVDDLTIDDPATFAKPWHTKLTYRKMPGSTAFQEDSCLDRVDAGQPAVDYAARTSP